MGRVCDCWIPAIPPYQRGAEWKETYPLDQGNQVDGGGGGWKDLGEYPKKHEAQCGDLTEMVKVEEHLTLIGVGLRD